MLSLGLTLYRLIDGRREEGMCINPALEGRRARLEGTVGIDVDVGSALGPRWGDEDADEVGVGF